MKQGDRIGRIFAYLVVDYYRSTYRKLLTTFTQCIYFVKKWVGLYFGRLFHKLIWSPCHARSTWNRALSRYIQNYVIPAMICKTIFCKIFDVL
jgi:hypothetical protein